MPLQADKDQRSEGVLIYVLSIRPFQIDVGRIDRFAAFAVGSGSLKMAMSIFRASLGRQSGKVCVHRWRELHCAVINRDSDPSPFNVP
jgi:hypothetical protein